MRIVVIGSGKVGLTLTEALNREGHDLTLIDNRKDVLSIAEERLDVMTCEGNGASVEVQKQAGVAEADLTIAVTNADEVNLICCMVARRLGCLHTIARIRNQDYNEAYYLLRDDLGLSMVVNPERTAAREIYGLIRYPSLLKRDLIAKGRAEIVEMPVRPGSKLDGIRLLDLYGMLKVRVLVCAVERDDDVYIPDGNFTLRGNDRIYVTAPSEYLLSLLRLTGLDNSKIKSVMILGGSRIAVYLCQMLAKAGIDIKLIDNNKSHCENLSEELNGVTVVNEDATDFSVLLNEGVEETDAIVSLINLDEQNIVVSMFANNLHVPKVITKINRTEYSDVLKTAGIECVITPKILASSDILRFVRAMENRHGTQVLSLHRLVENKIEALEFHIGPDSWYRGVPLRQVPLKKNFLIAVISHRGQITIPSGESTYNEGDTVVVVASSEQALSNLNDIFSKQP